MSGLQTKDRSGEDWGERHDCDSKLTAQFSDTKLVPLLQTIDVVQQQHDHAPAHLHRLEELLHEGYEFVRRAVVRE